LSSTYRAILRKISLTVSAVASAAIWISTFTWTFGLADSETAGVAGDRLTWAAEAPMDSAPTGAIRAEAESAEPAGWVSRDEVALTTLATSLRLKLIRVSLPPRPTVKEPRSAPSTTLPKQTAPSLSVVPAGFRGCQREKIPSAGPLLWLSLRPSCDSGPIPASSDMARRFPVLHGGPALGRPS